MFPVVISAHAGVEGYSRLRGVCLVISQLGHVSFSFRAARTHDCYSNSKGGTNSLLEDHVVNANPLGIRSSDCVAGSTHVLVGKA